MAVYDKAFESHPVAIGKAISKMERCVVRSCAAVETLLLRFFLFSVFVAIMLSSWSWAMVAIMLSSPSSLYLVVDDVLFVKCLLF